MSNSATSKSIIPFEQTVGFLIDYIHDGVEDGEATAIAIKGHFGPYCECNMAAWIADSIDQVATDATVRNKLRLLLKADPYAVIDRVVRQSPPEKLMRRFCETGDLKGAYLNLTGSEVVSTLAASSALCPPEATPEPEVEYWIKDSLKETTTTSEALSDRTIESSPITVRAVFPTAGPNAYWGSQTPTPIKFTITNNDNTYTYVMQITANTGDLIDTVLLLPEETKVLEPGYVLGSGATSVQLAVSENGRLYGSTPLSISGLLVFFPGVAVSRIEDITFTEHMPEIGLGYTVRNSQTQLTAAGASLAKVEEDATGLGWYGAKRSLFTSSGLKYTTFNITESPEGRPEFLNMTTSDGQFPPIHFNKTAIPHTNMETGITVQVPDTYNDNILYRGNYPGELMIALVFDTPSLSNNSITYDVGRSYESGYGSAFVIRIGQNAAGHEVKAKLYSRKNSNLNSDLNETEFFDIVQLFNYVYFSYANNGRLTSEEMARYDWSVGEYNIFRRIVDATAAKVYFETKISLRTYHGQICILINDIPTLALSNYGPTYNASVGQDLRCGFYVGSFSTENGNYAWDASMGYLNAVDYYVKPFTFTPQDINLTWSESNNYIGGLTAEQRSSTKSILIGIPWTNRINEPPAPAAFDTVINSDPFMESYNDIKFTANVSQEIAQHLDFSITGYVENETGDVIELFTRTVNFNSTTLIGTFHIQGSNGFIPDSYPDGYGSNVWWAELIIRYKGFIVGKSTIVYYTQHDFINGPYQYYLSGQAFLAMSKIIYT